VRLIQAAEVVQGHILEAVRVVERFFPYLAALASLVAVVSAVLKWGQPARKALCWLRTHSAHYQLRQLRQQVVSLERRQDVVQIDIRRLQSRVAALEATLKRLRRESRRYDIHDPRLRAQGMFRPPTRGT
jgi:septal ring factor EnvC (AmiA/AmiB activator)